MSNATALPSRVIRLMLVDADPVFRLGVRLGLATFPDLTIVTEATDGETALQLLATHTISPIGSASEPIDATATNVESLPGLDLVVIDLGLGRTDPNQIQGLTLCQQIKAQYPDLAVLLLSATVEPVLVAAARQAGANGFCAKSAEVSEVVATIRQINRHRISQSTTGKTFIRAQPSAAPLASSRPADSSRYLSPLTLLRRNWRHSGNQQIDRAITEITAALQNANLSLLDRAVLAGRYRELCTARWLLNRLLATPAFPDETTPDPASISAAAPPQPVSRRSLGNLPAIDQPSNQQAIVPTSNLSASLASGSAVINPRDIQSIVFDAVFSKLEANLSNQTEIPLETDILRDDRKRELFYLILRKFEDLLAELRYSQASIELLEQKRSDLLLDLWEATTIDFFGRYATVEVEGTAIEIVSVLLQEGSVVQSAILNKIPGFMALLSHLLFQTPIEVDSLPYPPGNPAALHRAELLLENSLIQVANAVIQPLLNRFANVEAIKQNFYDRRLLSSREIERFRNNLSWKYRVERLLNEPRDIFASQYHLFTVAKYGIQQTTIYAPRNQELAQLSGIPLIVTLALETRDAIAPRLRSTVSFVGNGVIYVLTNVIGRGIGLIGRGILEGIGNVFQDDRFSRK